MNTPPIFAAVAAYAPAVTLLKDPGKELRFYLFGQAPQNVKRPYAVWRQAYGSPANFIDKRPDTDNYGTQIDVYAPPEAGGAGSAVARSVATAIRDAIEGQAYVTSWRGESRDPETQNFVFSFDAEWFVKR